MSTSIKSRHYKAIAFFDGQNLFHSVKESFGYCYPNYNPRPLAQVICDQKGWELANTRFYTGVPNPQDNPFWNRFWNLKLGAMRRQQNVYIFSRPLKYRKKTIACPDGQKFTITVGDEKGIDVRIAIDAISLAFKKQYDIALIFSQDQDLSEVADDIRGIAKIQNRFIKIASAFPRNPIKKYLKRGINKTDWMPFNKDLYDTCLDPRDYRPLRHN